MGAYTFDQYKQEKDEFLPKEAQVPSSSTPTTSADAEARKARYAWVSENVNRARDLINEPGAVVTPEYIADRAARGGQGGRPGDRDPGSRRPQGARLPGPPRAWARAALTRPRMVILRHVPRKASKETHRPRGQGHHLRLGRDQPQARRQDVGDEGRHGGRGGRALRDARARPPRARRQGGRHPLLRREPARRERAAPGRHLHGQERQVDHGRQHRRRGPPRADRRPARAGRGGRHPRASTSPPSPAPCVRALGPERGRRAWAPTASSCGA